VRSRRAEVSPEASAFMTADIERFRRFLHTPRLKRDDLMI
jgi:hypothetical protein